MNLARALRVARTARVAFTGAGGKTTALFQLARAVEPPVVVTSSTHLGAWQADLADHHLIISRAEDVQRFAGQIEGVTVITGPAGEDQRLQGLDGAALGAVHELAGQLGFPVLVEADGSRQKPLKAPADHEPVIPAWIDTVVVVAGLSALGKPLGPETVHRYERYAETGEARTGQPVSEESIARMLVHPLGGLKGIPAEARRVALLNQADESSLVEAGFRIANRVTRVYHSILVSALSEQRIWQVIEPIAGIILAGGNSSRYGQPKMLLPWQGKALVRHAAESALVAGLDPVVVVTGAVVEPVREALSGLPIQFAHNAAWQEGQSTSVRAGLSEIPDSTGGAVFLLADQPYVTADLLKKLVNRYRAVLGPVTAPRAAGKRANPVLFDRDLFASLMELEGDTGGRAIIGQHPVTYVEWPDDRILIDIDRLEDYERLMGDD
ncbi:MAG: putative selenium-dependent hydroxylase accessory protein YqeC [Chloroflexi bacterium]|nr:MAG: putative selenium-dependent hydroxylase accessory protein YqeC [Chloroflexota bacterium]